MRDSNDGSSPDLSRQPKALLSDPRPIAQRLFSYFELCSSTRSQILGLRRSFAPATRAATATITTTTMTTTMYNLVLSTGLGLWRGKFCTRAKFTRAFGSLFSASTCSSRLRLLSARSSGLRARPVNLDDLSNFLFFFKNLLRRGQKFKCARTRTYRQEGIMTLCACAAAACLHSTQQQRRSRAWSI